MALTRGKIWATVTDGNGTAVLSARVRVCKPGTSSGYGTGTVVTDTLYTARSGGTTKANPSTTNTSGYVEWWYAVPGTDVPGDIDIEWDDNGGTASPTGQTGYRTVSIPDVAGNNTMLDYVLDVTKYGTVGDGATDDTAAIQNAINAATAITYVSGEIPSGGNRVYLPPGNYKVSALTIPDGINFVGAGSTSTKLSITGAGLSFTKASGSSYTRNFVIEGLRLAASGASAVQAILLKDVGYYRMRDVHVHGAYTTAGIWLNGGFGGDWSNVRIERVTGLPGLLIDPTGSTAATNNTHSFNACSFRVNGTGVKATAAAATTGPNGGEMVFTSCVFESNTSIGTDFAGTGPYTFNGCHWESSTTYHIQTAAVNTHRVTGLRFNNCSFDSWKMNFAGDHETEFNGIHPAYSAPATLGRITLGTDCILPVFRHVMRIVNANNNTNGAINFASGGNWPTVEQPRGMVALTDAATVNTPLTQGDYFTLSTNAARTIADPLTGSKAIDGGPRYYEDDVQAVPRGWDITYQILNNGGSGAITWNAAFKKAAWTDPANGKYKLIRFRFDGTNWWQLSDFTGDI